MISKTHICRDLVRRSSDWCTFSWLVTRPPCSEPKRNHNPGPVSLSAACGVDISPIWMPIEMCRSHADQSRCRSFSLVWCLSYGFPFFAFIFTVLPSYCICVIVRGLRVLGARSMKLAPSILKQDEGPHPLKQVSAEIARIRIEQAEHLYTRIAIVWGQ